MIILNHAGRMVTGTAAAAAAAVDEVAVIEDFGPKVNIDGVLL